MSVQFGRWNFKGQRSPEDYIKKVSAILARYGPDSNDAYFKGGVTILYRAFHTTKESRRETQPHISCSGTVITWDGRLDNRAELISELRDALTISSTDVAIVAAAYEKWDISCFAKLIGDWALSIWNPVHRSLILAKDPIGTHHLHYSFDNNQITWCTLLDPLLRFEGNSFTLNEEYVAGWLSYFPAAHLTPYLEIHSVPPSSSVLLRPGKHTVSKYWDFDPEKKIRYRTDAEYEEHFRSIFAKAVQRRLRSDHPVLAELSGGMDSSSIVCMADTVIARGAAETPRLDTVSWYDDSYDHIERDTNELHWIIKVEEQRGRTGLHIDLRSLKEGASSQQSFLFEFDNDRLASIPSPNREVSERSKQCAAYMLSQGHRVTLSGIGGDEVTGGGVVPTPTLELQDLLVRARFGALVHQLNTWATKMKKPRLHLLWEAAQGFLTLALTGRGSPKDMRPAPWFRPGFIRRNRAALCGYPSRVKLFGPLPSFQANVVTLNVLRRTLTYSVLNPQMLREVRFPYLDRDLLEFLYAIPRDQIVGVGKRRFLMRRALVGIVPDEVLNRRRKAFVSQVPKCLSTEWARLIDTAQHIRSSRRFINPSRFLEVLQGVRHNQEAFMLSLMRTVTLECWLRHLVIQGVLTNSMAGERPEPKELRAPRSIQKFS